MRLTLEDKKVGTIHAAKPVVGGVRAVKYWSVPGDFHYQAVNLHSRV